MQADLGGRSPAGRTGDDQQPAQHVRPRAQGRAERPVHRGHLPAGADVYPPRPGGLARHPRGLPATGRPPAGDPPRRPRGQLPPRQIRGLHPRRHRLDRLPRIGTERSPRGGQQRGGADHAGRLPQFRSRALSRDPAGRRPAGNDGPPGPAELRRAAPRGFALAGPATNDAHRFGPARISP